MARLDRDPGDTADDMRPATYVSSRRRSYRLLPSLEVPGGWRIHPDPAGPLAWLGPLWPSYLAVPRYDPSCGIIYCYAVYRAGQGTPGKPVGYGSDLSDICWPAEDDLIKIRHRAGLLAGIAGADVAPGLDYADPGAAGRS